MKAMEEPRGAGRLHVAVDGPAASGKSTVALGLARRVGLTVVDSGSMYRAVALLSVEEGVSAGDRQGLAALAGNVASSFRLELRNGETLRVFLGDREVTDDIRSPQIGGCVSPVSEEPGVREQMVASAMPG